MMERYLMEVISIPGNISLSNIGSKIPFTPKGGRFYAQNYLGYLDLCYVNSSYTN